MTMSCPCCLLHLVATCCFIELFQVKKMEVEFVKSSEVSGSCALTQAF